jgi:carbonic anhydrase/acetyltransferase-like protein (isoleucine patch superfamily)
MILSYQGKTPQIAEGVFIAPTAVLIGDVVIGANANIWFGAVLRGDLNQIMVGENSSVQDNCVLHCNLGHATIVRENCIVGHGAVLEGCIIGAGTMVGMNATVLSGAVLGENSLIAAGALIRENVTFPERALLAGVPAALKREVSQEQIDAHFATLQRYQGVMRNYPEFPHIS